MQAGEDQDVLVYHLNFTQRLLEIRWLVNIGQSETTPVHWGLFDTCLGKMLVPPDWWLQIQRLMPLALGHPLL